MTEDLQTRAREIAARCIVEMDDSQRGHNAAAMLLAGDTDGSLAYRCALAAIDDQFAENAKIAAERDAALARVEADGWRDISTAPKDGTLFLGGHWHEDGSGEGPKVWAVAVTWWDPHFATDGWDDAADDCIYVGGWTAGRVGSFQYEEYTLETPELWRPLPSPPSGAMDREEGK